MRTLFAIAVSFIGTAVVSAPAIGPSPAPCYLTVNVPVGATLTVNGVRTEQMTAVRKFVSPKLTPGDVYYYTFVAYYTQDGEGVSQKQQVEVKAGASVTVDLVNGEVIKSNPKPTPPKSPFDEPAPKKNDKKDKKVN